MPKTKSICLFFLLLSSGLSASATDESVGKIAVANGTVKIISAKGETKAAKPGDSIANDDRVETGAMSSAKLLFTDQSIIDLSANSAFKVSDYSLKNGEDRTGTFSLMYGKIRSMITKKVSPAGKVEYRSGSTVMGVRGTEFLVDSPRGAGGAATNTSLVVVGGSVAVGSVGGAAPVMVKPGESVSVPMLAAGAGGGSPIQVKQVSAQEMKTALSSATTSDKTFDSAVTIAPQKKGEGGESMAMQNVASIVGATLEAKAEKSGDSEAQRMEPDFLDDDDDFLPPVLLTPGSPVELRVIVD